MKHIIIFLMLFSCCAFSQSKALQLTNIKTGKIVIIKDNSRVKIKTNKEEKIVARIQIIDNSSLKMDEQTLLLSDITVVKKRSVGKALASAGMIFGGIMGIGFASVVAISDSISAIVVACFGGLTVTAGSLLPDLNNGHHSDKWDYKIIDLSN